MTTALYDLTVPVMSRALGNLARILDKGRAFAEAQGLDPAVLVGARLYPDMGTLAAQVQRASDTAKGAMVRLGAVPNRPFPDEEKTIAELQERIAKTVAFLGEVTPAALDGREEAQVTLSVGGLTAHFTGRAYVLEYVLPNFFFHVTTAYALLRHVGVKIGKIDYLGPR